MKVIRYCQIPRQALKRATEQAEEMIRFVEPVLMRRFRAGYSGLNSLPSIPLKTQLPPLLYCCGGNLAGKTVLDLGCGSRNNPDEGVFLAPRIFEPWLCRTLLLLGANPIGIDVRDNSHERFESHRADVSSDSLGFLPRGIGVINAYNFFNAPSFTGNLKEVTERFEQFASRGFFLYE